MRSIPLSVVIPCLNEADAIGGLLTRLSPWRRRGVEIIVVDGGSEDETAQIARPLADQVLAGTRGRALQMNAGAAAAAGDTLLFLHADCMPPADADRLVLAQLETTHRLWGRFDVHLVGRPAFLRVIAAAMNLRSRLTGIATGDQGLFVRRTAFEAVGGYPAIPLMEDIALCRRLKRLGPPLCLAERLSASGRRWEKHGVARTILLMWRLRLAYSLGADPEQLAAQYAPHRS